jgi:thiol-disulfide isomerase/thioredoxin
MPLAIGAPAPSLPDVAADGPHALIFFKVTCAACQLAAPKLEALQAAYAGHIQAVGQDPADKLRAFGAEYHFTLPTSSDAPPYDLSNAYGVETVPTMFVIDGQDRVADVVEAWDRDGLNRASATLAELLGVERVAISEPSDGLPGFKPG